VSPKRECLIVHNRRMIEITSASGFKPRRRARVLSKTDGQLSTMRAIARSGSKVRMAAKNVRTSQNPQKGTKVDTDCFSPRRLGSHVFRKISKI